MNTVKQGIELIKAKDFEELSRISAKVMVECVRNKPDSLFCIATGISSRRREKSLLQYISKRPGKKRFASFHFMAPSKCSMCV